MIEAFVKSRFSCPTPNQVAWQEAVIEACIWFRESGLADPKFEAELTSGSDHKFWACLSEALLASRIGRDAFLPRRNIGTGPDFLITDGERRIWVEVTCPEPSGIAQDWLAPSDGCSGGFVPFERITLRWTGAIRTKAERLVGCGLNGPPGYLQSRLVQPEDAYVIAVNGCRLRNGPFPALDGISGFPVAAEVAFAIGPQTITIDRDTLEAVQRGPLYRPYVRKSNGADVHTHTFLDERYAPISAIWAVDLNCSGAFGGQEPMCVVHNPNAVNPVRSKFLPSDHDYIPKSDGDYFVLERP